MGGAPSTGYLKFNVTITPLGEMAEDGMTEMSGMTDVDQDLDGERERERVCGACVCAAALF